MTSENITEGKYAIVSKEGILKVCRVDRGQVYAIKKLKFRLDDAIEMPFGSCFNVQTSGYLTVSTSKPKDTATDECILPESNGANGDPSNGANAEGCSNGTPLLPEAIAMEDDSLKLQPNSSANDAQSRQGISQAHIEVGKLGIWRAADTIDRLTKNNAGFSARTEMSKDKYIKKKRRKYGDELLILKPTIRLIWQCYFHKDPLRLDNMTLVSLGLMLGYANIQAGCAVCVFDFCLGMVTAAVLQRLAGGGSCVHVHQHDQAQGIPFVHSMNLTEREMAVFKPVPGFEFIGRDPVEATLDAVLVAGARFDLADTIPELVARLKPSRHFVMYSSMLALTLSCYTALKALPNMIDVTVIESNGMQHQILKGRSHPVMKQNAGRGYVLYGVKVDA